MPRERNCILGCEKTPTMYSFPYKKKDVERRKKWKRLLGIRGRVGKRIYACQRHFSAVMVAGKRLRKNAVPDVGVQEVEKVLTDPTCSFLNQLKSSEVPALRQIGKILSTAVKKRQTTEFICNESATAKSSIESESDSESSSCVGSELNDDNNDAAIIPTVNKDVAEISRTAGMSMGILPENYTNDSVCINVCSDAAEILDIIGLDQSPESCDDAIPEASCSSILTLDDSNSEKEEPLGKVTNQAQKNIAEMEMYPISSIVPTELSTADDESINDAPDPRNIRYHKSIRLSRDRKRYNRKRVKMVKKFVQTSPVRSESSSPTRNLLTEEINNLKAQIKDQDKEMRDIYRRRGKLLEKLKLLKNGNDHQLVESFCNRLPAGLGRLVRKKVKVYFTNRTRYLSIPYIQKKSKEMELVEYPILYDDYE